MIVYVTFIRSRAVAVAAMVAAKFELRADARHSYNPGSDLWVVELTTSDLPPYLENRIDTFVNAASALLSSDVTVGNSPAGRVATIPLGDES